MNGSAVLRVVAASKSFGATQAVRDVSLEVGPGEVVALVGENGAGKSTLIRLISGELAADSGEVWVGGRSLTADPHLARKSGVAVIHQELSYVPTMTVAENLMLARMPRRRLRWLVDRRRLLSSAAAAIRTIDDTIRLDAQMSDLTVGNRQVVEIARAVGAEPDLLLLDEPTAALDAREVDRLFAVIRSLRARGIGMIYVSHRLAELESIADRFVVMRDGAVVATHEEVVDRDRLVGEIVGRQLSARVPHALAGDTTAGDVGLAVDLTTDGALRQLTFHARKGQAIGLYGLPGSGVESVARAIVGDISTGGSIQIGNVKLGPRRTPRQCCRAGIAHVPSDRRGEGLFAELPMRTNISIGALAMRSPWRFLTRSAEDANAGPLAKRADVRPARLASPVSSLSGGNQQKVMFARWLATRPRVMVLDQPTRGVDVGAKAQIYDLIDDLRSDGAVVVVISPEPDELIQVCDVIGVLHDGEIAGFHLVEDIEEEELVALAMTGREQP